MTSCNAAECPCFGSEIDPTSGACPKCPHDYTRHANYPSAPELLAKLLIDARGVVHRVLCITCGASLPGPFGGHGGIATFAAVQQHRRNAHSDLDGVAAVFVTATPRINYFHR